MAFSHQHGCFCDVLGEEEEEEEEAAKEANEEELQLSALDCVSSSPGKTGLSSVDTNRLSPREDADTTGEREIY